MATVQTADPIPADTSLEKKLEDVKLETAKTADAPPSSATASIKEQGAGVRKLPIVEPAESTHIPPLPVLTADQEEKYKTLLEEVKTLKEVPSTQGKAGPITDNELIWLTRECLLRYLRAVKWSVPDASKRLIDTLTWRREYGVDELTPDHISPENETGKQIILGYDNDGRPCHYLNPGRQNTAPSPRQVQHLVFMLERVIEMGIPGQETLSLLINFKPSKTRKFTAPSIGMGKEVLNILQTHYPERLGKALIINVPFLVWGFFKLITPFIDPLTKEKLKFNDDMRQFVPPSQLWTEFLGDLEFDYEHGTYWPALNQICQDKRAAAKLRWEKAGKLVGESEAYLKGANVPSVGQSSQASETTSDVMPEKVAETLPAEVKPTEVKQESATA